MPHPVHEILRRFLGSEQFAFGAGELKQWPWESRDAHEPDPDESDDEDPAEFDDVYPWLEPGK